MTCRFPNDPDLGSSYWQITQIGVAFTDHVRIVGNPHLRITVPDALGNKIIHAYSDFLLHDIETGDGIVQNPPEDTATKLRTVPLWGLRMHPRHMHDLKSLTLESAIERHGGEAAQERNRFRDLTAVEKQALITFLNSL